MRRDDLTVDLFRSCGRLLHRGASVRVPELPRSKRSLTVLKLEAKRDQHVRLAYQASQSARPASLRRAEKARQLKPQVLRRNCGTILDVR
jgi:hypothetical protein